MIWSRTIGRSVACTLRSLSNRAHTQIDIMRHGASASQPFRRYFRSRSMGRNNGCKVRLFRIWRALFPRFLFGNVTFDAWRCLAQMARARTWQTLTVLTIGLSWLTRDTMDVLYTVSQFTSCIPYNNTKSRQWDFVRKRGTSATPNPAESDRNGLYTTSFAHWHCRKMFSGHVITEECRPFSRVFNRLIHFRASRIIAMRIMHRCFKGMCNGQVETHAVRDVCERALLDTRGCNAFYRHIPREWP